VGKVADTNLCGASGTKYKFGVYTLETSFKNIGAVYIFTKRVENDVKRNRDFLYIGQTEELADRIYNHEKWPRLERNDVHFVCVHVDENENSRQRKEADLLQAVESTCNK